MTDFKQIKNIAEKIKLKILRTSFSFFYYRPSSHPYISGDGFRAMADHIYDDIEKCNATKIKNGDIVFLKTDLIVEWFENIHPLIGVRYTLITHNSDAVVGPNETKYIDSKIIRWFAQNNVIAHPKVTPIPIGIENRRLFMHGWMLEKMAQKLKSKNTPKKDRILFGFNVQTNTNERTSAMNALRNILAADEIKGRFEIDTYFELLNTYKFVVSPEGNGPDCIRTYEAIILGVVPIIKNTSNNQVLIQHTLPILLVDQWSDVGSRYKGYDIEVKSDITMFDYWEKIIKKKNE